METFEMVEKTRRISTVFCDETAAALAEICGPTWRLQAGEPTNDTHPHMDGAITLRFDVSGAYGGKVFLVLEGQALNQLCFRDLGEDTPDLHGVRKSRMLSAIQGRLGNLRAGLPNSGEVSMDVRPVDDWDLGEVQTRLLSVRPEGQQGDPAFSLFLCIGQDLISELAKKSVTPFEFVPASSAPSANLDLVMDVELNVTLRFGQRLLALREVLELTSGSVVELDRQVDEPVELILDGRVVARGEAVIIDGNYGMRVTQVVQSFVS